MGGYSYDKSNMQNSLQLIEQYRKANGISPLVPDETILELIENNPDKSIFGEGFYSFDNLNSFSLTKSRNTDNCRFDQDITLLFLSGICQKADTVIEERGIENGVVSSFINFIHDNLSKKNLGKSEVQKEIKRVENEIDILIKAANGEIKKFNSVSGIEEIVSFEEKFKELRGVEYSFMNVLECQEKASDYAIVKNTVMAINQTKNILSFVTSGDVNSQVHPERTCAEILKAFNFLEITSKADINQTLKLIEETYPELSKSGKDYRIHKNKNGKYMIYKTSHNGPLPATNDELKIIAKEIGLRLDRSLATAIGVEYNPEATPEEMTALTQEIFDAYKKDYEASFEKAYGKKDLEILAEKYVSQQQKGVATFEAVQGILSMVVMLAPPLMAAGGSALTAGGANVALKAEKIARAGRIAGTADKIAKTTTVANSLTKSGNVLLKTGQILTKPASLMATKGGKATHAAIAANMVIRPTDLVEKAGNGLTGEELVSWGEGVLTNATFMGIGIGSSMLGQYVASLKKTKSLINVFKNAGKSSEDLVKCIKSNPTQFPEDVVTALQQANKKAVMLQISVEASTDILMTFALNKAISDDGFIPQQVIMSIAFALCGGTIQKQFMPLSTEAKVKHLKIALKEFEISDADAMRILTAMDEISAGHKLETYSKNQEGAKQPATETSKKTKTEIKPEEVIESSDFSYKLERKKSTKLFGQDEVYYNGCKLASSKKEFLNLVNIINWDNKTPKFAIEDWVKTLKTPEDFQNASILLYETGDITKIKDSFADVKTPDDAVIMGLLLKEDRDTNIDTKLLAEIKKNPRLYKVIKEIHSVWNSKLGFFCNIKSYLLTLAPELKTQEACDAITIFLKKIDITKLKALDKGIYPRNIAQAHLYNEGSYYRNFYDLTEDCQLAVVRYGRKIDYTTVEKMINHLLNPKLKDELLVYLNKQQDLEETGIKINELLNCSEEEFLVRLRRMAIIDEVGVKYDETYRNYVEGKVNSNADYICNRLKEIKEKHSIALTFKEVEMLEKIDSPEVKALFEEILSNKNITKNEKLRGTFITFAGKVYYENQINFIKLIIENEKLYNNENLLTHYGNLINQICYLPHNKNDYVDFLKKYLESYSDNPVITKKLGDLTLSSTRPLIYNIVEIIAKNNDITNNEKLVDALLKTLSNISIANKEQIDFLNKFISDKKYYENNDYVNNFAQIINVIHEENFDFANRLFFETDFPKENIEKILKYTNSYNASIVEELCFNIDFPKNIIGKVVENIKSFNSFLVLKLCTDPNIPKENIPSILGSIREDNTRFIEPFCFNNKLSKESLAEIIANINHNNIDFARKLCFETDFPEKYIPAVLRNITTDKISIAEKLCFECDFPKDLLGSLLSCIDSINKEFAEMLCFESDIDKELIVEILRRTKKDNIELSKMLCFESDMPKEYLPNILQETTAVKFEFAKRLCFESNVPKELISVILNKTKNINLELIQRICFETDIPRNSILEFIEYANTNDAIKLIEKILDNPVDQKWLIHNLDNGVDTKTTLDALYPTQEKLYSEANHAKQKNKTTSEVKVKTKDIKNADIIRAEEVLIELGVHPKMAPNYIKLCQQNGIVDQLKLEAICQLVKAEVPLKEFKNIFAIATGNAISNMNGIFRIDLVKDIAKLKQFGVGDIKLATNISATKNMTDIELHARINTNIREDMARRIDELPLETKQRLREEGINLDVIKEKALVPPKAGKTKKNVVVQPTTLRSLESINGVERIVLDKFKSEIPQEVWADPVRFKTWAEEKLAKVMDFEQNPNYTATGAYAHVTKTRKELVENWYKYLTEESNYKDDVFVHLLVMDGITKEFKTNNANIPPAISHRNFEATYNALLAADSKVSFSSVYAQQMRERAIKDFSKEIITEGDIKGRWVTIPRSQRNSANYSDNIAMVQSLSEGSSWCLRFENAHSYLQSGNLHFFVDENGLSQVAINETDGVITQIQKRYEQDSTVPVAYAEVISNWAKAHKFIGQEYAIGTALQARPKYLQLKNRIKTLMDNKDYLGIFKELGINVEVLPDGTYKIKGNYIPTSLKSYTYAELGIDENTLMQNVSIIDGTLSIKGSKLTKMLNLKSVKSISAKDTKSIDLRNLEKVNGKRVYWDN